MLLDIRPPLFILFPYLFRRCPVFPAATARVFPPLAVTAVNPSPAALAILRQHYFTPIQGQF